MLPFRYLTQDFDNVYAPVVREHRSVDTLDDRAEGLQYKAVAIAKRSTCEARAQSETGPLTIATSQGLRSVRPHPHAAITAHASHAHVTGSWLLPDFSWVHVRGCPAS